MEKDPNLLEQMAYAFLIQEKFAEAFDLYQKAARIYKSQKNHQQAALCFASAASCWSKKSGEKTFDNAALSYQEAAKEAVNSADLEYAALLYKYAAINYERDREFVDFSECFYQSKETYRKFLILRLLDPRKIHPIAETKEKQGLKGAIKRFFLCIALTISYHLWGHGERPVRTFFAGILIVFLAAFFYTCGHLLQDGMIIQPNFGEALYFSVITFTTVGYGDLIPIGFTKLIVTIEAFCGLFITPVFFIALSRKYLRV